MAHPPAAGQSGDSALAPRPGFTVHLPPFWSRARVDEAGEPDPRGPAVAFGWSDVSAEAAYAHGLSRARQAAAVLRAWRAGNIDAALGDQYYPFERPMREPVVSWLGDGAPWAGAITRNAYGAFVLNTTRALFADLDLPPPPRVAWWARLWGAKPAPVADGVPARVAAVVAANPGLGLRLYRTAAGYRALVTSSGYAPTGAPARALLEALGSDPLYVRLTEAQACFRARLTPKPWRVGVSPPQTSYFPWDDDPERKRRFEAWDQGYGRARAGAAVCRFVGAYGAPEVDAEVAPVLAVHDAWCCAGEGPLA